MTYKVTICSGTPDEDHVYVKASNMKEATAAIKAHFGVIPPGLLEFEPDAVAPSEDDIINP